MNSDNQHIDGDDYTWGGDALQPAAVLKPADAFAELQAQFGAYFDAIPDVDAFVREQRGCEPGTVAAWVERWRIGSGVPLLDELTEIEPARVGPDLRTLAEQERDDVAALRGDLDRLAELVRLKTGPVDVALEVDMQRDKLGDFEQRLAALERTVAALVKVLEVRL